jgi:hypothetical protein
MTKLFFMILVALLTTVPNLAQSADEPSKHEFFMGYSYNSADINSLTINPQRTGQQGAELAYTRYLTKRVGITGGISGHFSRRSQTTGITRINTNRDQYYVLAGVQFRAPNSSRVTPFAHVLAGASAFRGYMSSITGSTNIYTFDDDMTFAAAFGGGLDARVSKRIAIRLIQADYIPTFFGSGRQDNIRLSFGVVIR